MKNGVLTVEVRAGGGGPRRVILLRRWNVDCTEDADLHGPEYQLWLRNRVTLVDTPNLGDCAGVWLINDKLRRMIAVRFRTTSIT